MIVVSRWCIRGCATPTSHYTVRSLARTWRWFKVDPNGINLRKGPVLVRSFRIFPSESVEKNSVRPLVNLRSAQSMANADDPQNPCSSVVVDNGGVESGNPFSGDEITTQSSSGNGAGSGVSQGRSVQDLPEWAIARTASTPPKMLTLVIVHRDGKVLLGMKKRGFGKGYYNGFGGKVEKGETIDEAAKRELQEEAGIAPVDMSERGVLTFHFDHDPVSWEVHVYHVSEIVGDPYETEEMAPRWFSVSEIPYETMWTDDVLWYPAFLGGQSFKGSFYFENTTTLVSHSLRITSKSLVI